MFGGLPEATHDELDATGHGAPDVDDSMEMIGHDGAIDRLEARRKLAHFPEVIKDGTP